MGDLFHRLDQALVPPLAELLCRLAGGRNRRSVLTGLGMVGAFTALVTVVMAARTPSPGLGEVAGPPLRVGVAEGGSIPAYVAAARAKLAALPPEPTFALVSLTAYLGPDRLGALLGGAPPSRVYLRVPIPGVSTEVIPVQAHRLPDDVLVGMDAAAERKDGDVAIARQLAARLTGDGPRERELRAEYAQRAERAAAEATAYREHCSCVYAAVVRATPTTLTELSRRPGVRVVDPTPGLGGLERVVFQPPMPEQQAIATDPAELAPSPSPPAPSPSASAPSPRATGDPRPPRTPVPSTGAPSAGSPTAWPSSPPPTVSQRPARPTPT